MMIYIRKKKTKINTLTGMCVENDRDGDQRYRGMCGGREHDAVFGRSSRTRGPGQRSTWAARKGQRVCCCESRVFCDS